MSGFKQYKIRSDLATNRAARHVFLSTIKLYALLGGGPRLCQSYHDHEKHFKKPHFVKYQHN